MLHFAFTCSKPLLTRSESADLLTKNGFQITKNTLQKLASVGGGPEYKLFGNKALYAPEELESWALGRLESPS